MKKLLLFAVLLLLLAGCAIRKPPVTPPGPADFTLDVSVTSEDLVNFPPCSAALSKGCITGYPWGYCALGSTASACAAPVTVKTAPPPAAGTTVADQSNALLPMGTQFGWISLSYNDQNGAAQTTAAAIVAMSTPAGAPFTAVISGALQNGILKVH
jgi:hypothetical protein